MGIEVLIPDFDGSDDRLRTVMDARPDILNHNLETVRRLQKPVRKRARWDRTLYVLRRAKEMAREIGYPVHTKSSLMVGLGETRDELQEAFEALRENDVDILTIGQYLRPSMQHLPLERYYHPDEFAEMKAAALALGFKHVESAPLVRSSYHARDQVPGAELKRCAARPPSTPRAASSRSPAELGRASRPGTRRRASDVTARHDRSTACVAVRRHAPSCVRLRPSLVALAAARRRASTATSRRIDPGADTARDRAISVGLAGIGVERHRPRQRPDRLHRPGRR